MCPFVDATVWTRAEGLNSTLGDHLRRYSGAESETCGPVAARRTVTVCGMPSPKSSLQLSEMQGGTDRAGGSPSIPYESSTPSMLQPAAQSGREDMKYCSQGLWRAMVNVRTMRFVSIGGRWNEKDDGAISHAFISGTEP